MPDRMRSLAVCGSAYPALEPDNPTLGALELEGVRLLAGVVRSAPPRFDRADPANAHRVLVHVRAFSCNYRDRGIALRLPGVLAPHQFTPLGSEFAGEVVAVGPRVTRVRAGDRVTGDNTYADAPLGTPTRPAAAAHGGIPSNHASRELLVLHEEKVARVPAAMPDAVAAAFGIGAQTAFSMVDKLRLSPGAHVLVTAARSSTSLCALQALRGRGVHATAVTSSTRDGEALRRAGAADVFVVERAAASFAADPALREHAHAVGGFDGVIDPFFDLHLVKAVPLMRSGGRYVSCGFYDQHTDVTGGPPPGPRPDYAAALSTALVRNLSIIGNCVGHRAHLEAAFAAWEAGVYDVTLDRVLTGEPAPAFLARTFLAPDRFGKVVYAYA